MSPGLLTITIGLGFVAIAHCIYLAIQLFFFNRKTNLLLVLLLLTLSIRIGKSLFALWFPDITSFLSAVGLVAMAAIGPLLYFYVTTILDSEKRFWPRDSIHFIPSVLLGIVFSFVLSDQTLYIGYCLVTVQLLSYLAFSILFLVRDQEIRSDDIAFHWLSFLVAGIFALSLAFAIQIIVDNDVVYFIAVSISVVVLYALSLLAKNYNKVFLPIPRKQSVSLQHYELAKRIEELMIKHEAYQDPYITVSKMASRLDVPHYTLSQTINSHFNKTFPELLLYYRLKKAEQLLTMPDNGYITIEAIAYESGFSTLSAFYGGFKKIYQITPAQYREKMKTLSGYKSS